MKSKRKIAFGLCLFYLFSVIGLAISMHYCAGKLSSFRLMDSAACVACKQPQKRIIAHSCCKTTDLVLKIKDSHQGGLKVQLPSDFGVELFSLSRIRNLMSAFVTIPVRLAGNKAPPLSAICSLHLYHCVFRN